MGIAKGTTAEAVSDEFTSTSSSLGLTGLPPPFIILMAIKNTKIPPATWNDPTEMPNNFSKLSPSRVKKQIVINTVKQVICATRLRSCVVQPFVMLKNSPSALNGLISTTNARIILISSLSIMPYSVIIYVAIYIMKKLDIVAQSHPKSYQNPCFCAKILQNF